MRKIIGLFVTAGMLAMAGAALGQESQPAAPAAANGPTYEQFQAAVSRFPEMTVGQLAAKYSLDDQQRQAALEMLQRRAQKFLEDNGPTLFEMVKQGQEISRQMMQSGGKMSDVPEETRKQMSEKGLALIDLFQKQATEFADELRPTLRPEQQQKLDEDRANIEKQMERGREQMRAIAAGQMPGLAPAAPGPADAAPGAPAATAAPAAKVQAFTGGPGNPDNWESYVRMFIAAHKLDEVQKVQAMDILKKYQEKAKALPPSEPVAAPAAGATQPAAEEIARRMAARSKPFVALFGQMKAELDQIPTPVQKQLAGEGSTSAPSGRPSKPPVPASQAQGQAK